jgi:hypothetical protein
MTPTKPSPIRTWVVVAHLDREVLTRPLAELRLSARVLAACTHLRVATVAEVLGLPEAQFRAVPGVGARSWQTLVTHVRRVLAPLAAEADAAGGTSDPALAECFADPRTRLALARLGYPDRATLLRQGRDAALALPGVTAAELDALPAHPAAPAAREVSFWPERFLRYPVRDLGLPAALVTAFASAGVSTLGALLQASPPVLAERADIGAAGVDALRVALARMLARDVRVRRTRTLRTRRDGGLRRLLRQLDADDRAFLLAHVGLDGHAPVPRARLALLLGLPATALAEREARCRTQAHTVGHRLLARWRRAAARELAAQDGAVRGERLARGVLRRIAHRVGDAQAPLRLLAFLFPDELHVVGDVLTTVDAATCRRLLAAIRALRSQLPKPLAAVEAEFAASGLPAVPRGLLLHLLHHDAHVQVVIDPVLGEVLHRRRVTVGDRIEHVLRDARGALPIADLMFRYRDRYGCARRARLLDQLWAEPRFLEIGPGTWDLRERHVDQAELIEAEAARVRDTICTVGGRHELGDLIEGGASSERVLFLLRDRLRRDPALRNLGRGAFCSRSVRTSAQMEALLRALRAAGGELPLERFLANQDKATRDLRTRLLRENRLFVAVAPDRIDALSNYPFNPERLRTLLRTVELHLEQHDGFDHTAGVLAAIGEAGLFGDFLTKHLLRDLLLRHGRFELLADELIALRSRGLKAWIQQRAREAIRRAARGLTAFEIQTEIPELAQFAGCLEAVIQNDPMVQCPDGLHYVVV